MIRLASGNTIFWTQRLSDGVSYRLDPEISPPYPKSWSAGIFAKTFSESHDEFAGLRDRRISYERRSYSPTDDHSTAICRGRRDRKAKGDDGEWVEEKVFVVRQGLLERECRMVTGLFCHDGGDRRGAGPQIFKMARGPGFRSSEA